MQIIEISEAEVTRLLKLHESHFLDFKSKRIAPAKLVRSISAFANSDGGELYVGLEEGEDGEFSWDGFEKVEDANGLVQTIEACAKGANEVRIELLKSAHVPGYWLCYATSDLLEQKKRSCSISKSMKR